MKRMKGKILAILMLLAMAFTMMPIMGAPVYADDPAPAAPGIALGSDVLSVGSNTSGAATVHMADKAWRVIGYGGEGVASSADTMTLISAGNLKTGVQFRADLWALDANHYSKSNLKTEVETVSSSFSDGEKSGIAARDLASGSYNGSDTDCIAGDEVKGAILWPLSTKEANAMNGDLRRLDGGSGRDLAIDYWWLRSLGNQVKIAAHVRGDGRITSSGNGVDRGFGVRPAFNFNLKSVIFTSVAAGGKSSGNVGAGSLKSVEPNSNNEWKLTLESGHDNFEVENVSTCDGKTVNIKYSGAVAKKGEYISAIITDENDTVKYYGNLTEFADGDSAQGVAKVTIEDKMEPTDKLYIFNEQLNGEKNTDYSSALNRIDVPEPEGHNYLWEYVNDGEHKGVCDKCGGEIMEKHTYNQGRCTVCNGACGHSSQNDSYSHDPEKHWKTCAYCGNVIEHEENHAWQDEWTADGTKHWHKCEVCQRKKAEANHSWDAGKVTKAATEKAEGVKTFTCTVCKATKTETIPKLKPSAPKVSGTPLAKLTAKSKSITISWNKIQGAAGYDIFFARCNNDNKKIVTKKVKTIKGNKTFKWTKSGLKKGTAYKAYVRAYVYKNGKKTYVKNSPLMHAYTGNGTKNYTNAKSVTIKNVKKGKLSLKKGKTYKIKASVKKMKKNKKLMPKSHAPTLRYMTSNSKIASVNSGGKITAKGKGTCYIYVYAHNGVSKQVKVTVK